MCDLKHLKAKAKLLGATVVDEKIGESHTCSVEAPAGFVWADDELHEVKDSSWRPWNPDYSDLIDRMASGIKPCPLGADCEWCNP